MQHIGPYFQSILVDWLTSQARYVRVWVSRRTMHASCKSPCHLSAKRCILGACFPLTTPFRTRFSPCRMARIAHVQGLRGCLYTLRCFHIPTYRFHGTVSACNSPKVTTSLGQRWASGCLGMVRSCSSTSENKAVIHSTVIIRLSSPRRDVTPPSVEELSDDCKPKKLVLLVCKVLYTPHGL